METAAQALLLLLAIGVVRAYLQGGWAGVDQFWRAKLIGGNA